MTAIVLRAERQPKHNTGAKKEMTTTLTYELTKGVDGEWKATLTGVITGRSDVLDLLGCTWSSMSVEGAIKKSMMTPEVSQAKRNSSLVFNCTYAPEPAEPVKMVEVPVVVGEEPAEEKKADVKPKTTTRRRSTTKKTTTKS